MTFDVDARGDVLVVRPSGPVFGGPEGADLHEYLHAAPEAGGASSKSVVVDLGRVALVNSSGLGQLVAAVTTLRGMGGDLRLASVSERVENLFVITRLSSVFKRFPSADAAVASFEQHS